MRCCQSHNPYQQGQVEATQPEKQWLPSQNWLSPVKGVTTSSKWADREVCIAQAVTWLLVGSSKKIFTFSGQLMLTTPRGSDIVSRRGGLLGRSDPTQNGGFVSREGRERRRAHLTRQKTVALCLERRGHAPPLPRHKTVVLCLWEGGTCPPPHPTENGGFVTKAWFYVAG